jgi:hypothetical protein
VFSGMSRRREHILTIYFQLAQQHGREPIKSQLFSVKRPGMAGQ